MCDNSVNAILEDNDGNFWFATHHNGVCRYDGTSFTHFDAKDGVEGIEAWSLFKDTSGNIWFPIENSGVYRYDGKVFANFSEKDGLGTNAIQCIYEDKQGKIWMGGYQGLFRLDGKSFVSVGKEGPWK
jgi:ligand-binding sensor domain-containing protein